jgi:hypothetical protein
LFWSARSTASFAESGIGVAVAVPLGMLPKKGFEGAPGACVCAEAARAPALSIVTMTAAAVHPTLIVA